MGSISTLIYTSELILCFTIYYNGVISIYLVLDWDQVAMEAQAAKNQIITTMTSNNVLFFFVPRACHDDQFTFHISLSKLKFTIFILFTIHSHDDFDIANASSMQVACHI